MWDGEELLAAAKTALEKVAAVMTVVNFMVVD